MRYFVIIFLVVTFCFSMHPARAPKIKAVQNKESQNSSIKQPQPLNPDPHFIDIIPDMRAIAGSAGKNIVFAEDGQNVAVIYGRYSGDPNNIFQVCVAYSTNRGNTWLRYGPISTFNAQRTYAAMDAEQNWPNSGIINFAWHQAQRISGVYDSSPAFYAKEVSYPDGLITSTYRLPNSGTWDVWLPSIAVKNGFVVIICVNNGTYLTTYDSYIWRSTDYGETWDDGRVFFPGPLDWMTTPHFRFGSDGYMFFLWNRQEVRNPDIYLPYYCESFNYGETWTDPQPLPPPDSNVTSWWYKYDCEVVRDTPVAAVEFGLGNLDTSKIFVYRPDSGGPGNWHFNPTWLICDSSIHPQTVPHNPNVAVDDSGNIFIGYVKLFIVGGDTLSDCGMFARPAHQDTWYDWGRITFYGRVGYAEFAHNAPLIANGDSTIIGMIYTDAGTYPTTGNLYFDYFTVPNPPIPPGVSVAAPAGILKQLEISVTPNPFGRRVRFLLPDGIGKVKLSIFDISGKLVYSILTDKELTWDARKKDGSKLNAGVYFYSISTTQSDYQGKIILTR